MSIGSEIKIIRRVKHGVWDQRSLALRRLEVAPFQLSKVQPLRLHQWLVLQRRGADLSPSQERQHLLTHPHTRWQDPALKEQQLCTVALPDDWWVLGVQSTCVLVYIWNLESLRVAWSFLDFSCNERDACLHEVNQWSKSRGRADQQGF